MSGLFHIRARFGPAWIAGTPESRPCHDLLLQGGEAFYIRNSDPRGSREPPNPVPAHDLLLQDSEVFPSVTGVKFDTITLEKRKI